MKTIIITGANGNLGKTVTSHFLEKGYRVLATVANEEGKKDLPTHEHLEIEIVDLRDEQAAAAFVQKAIDTHQHISAALLLAGGFAMGNIKSTTLEDIKRQIGINFDTAFTIAKPTFDHMLQHNDGRLVLIGSRPALKSADGKSMIAYSLSKTMLFKLAEYLNEEAKGKNVITTVVVPSTIDTPANRESMPNADTDKWVKPEALAEVFEFICSDKASALREPIFKMYNNA